MEPFGIGRLRPDMGCNPGTTTPQGVSPAAPAVRADEQVDVLEALRGNVGDGK
jgi:hypothetical protein